MNYTISEEFELPSKGLIYRETVNPIVKMRSMTTVEEMKRLSKTDDMYSMLAEIIDDCCIDKCGVSAYDMCIGDFTYLLHRLRVVTHGSDYSIMSVCPYCSNVNDKDINLDELELNTISSLDEVSKYLSITLPVSKKAVTLNFQTPRMLDAITRRKNEFDKKFKENKINMSLQFTLESLINTVDGETLDFVHKEKFVKDLPLGDVNYILKCSEKINERIGLNLSIDVDCDKCGLQYNTPFRVTPEFFGPRIDI